MQRAQRVGIGAVVLSVGCLMGACGTTPSSSDADDDTPLAIAPMGPTTLPSTVPPPTRPSKAATAGVLVPNVIGVKVAPARTALEDLGFVVLSFNIPCRRASPASQSVLASMEVPGKGTDVKTGATPLLPGTSLPAHSSIAVTWSECYPNGTVVPSIVGLTFAKAVRQLHQAGLAWSCFSSPKDAGTVATTPDPATTTTAALTALSAHGGNVVQSQGSPAGTVLKAHTPVPIVMHHCPR